jgi:PAS domain S-box-containing protein
MEHRGESPQELIEHYRILSEMATDYAFKTRIEPDGSVVLEWISDSWERDFGYRPDGPEDLFEQVHPDDRRRAAAQWAELLAGRPIEGEVRLLPRKGGELWVHFRTKPIIDATGRIVGTYGAMQDIHDRKAAEELWRQAEARFRAQYQSSPIPTYIWQKVGDDLVLIDFNRAAEALTSGSVSALLGRTARQLDVGPGFAADLDRVFETGETIKRESSRKLPSSGELKSLFVTMAKVPPNLVMVHAVDVTEWRKAEAERRELRAKLRSRPAS